MMKMINSIVSIFSNGTPPTVENATYAYTVFFTLYMLVLIFTVIFTALVWRSGNKVQDAITADANVKIEQAKKDAAKANLTSEHIKQNNIILQEKLEKTVKDTEIEKQKLAAMQIEVSDAKLKQAEAETSLEQLKAKLSYRTLTSQQRSELIKLLKLNGVKPPVLISTLANIEESMQFAKQLQSTLNDSGWESGETIAQDFYTENYPKGVFIEVHSAKQAPPYAAILQRALTKIGIEPQGKENQKRAKDYVGLFIGLKP